MTRLEISGIGIWSPFFGGWSDFRLGSETGEWRNDAALQPDLIPAKERRRAPQLVKMAVEVMGQACEMASMDPQEVSVVFSSSMGDMQITDYMCRALSMPEKLISPTRFHNSVHNAAPGYWSIATGANSASSAVSAFEHTATMALLESCIQVCTGKTPVLFVSQEIAAPAALMDACPSTNPFSAALLLMPHGSSVNVVSELDFRVLDRRCEWPSLPDDLNERFGGNPGARVLPILMELATKRKSHPVSAIQMPLSENATLEVSFGSNGE
jgi:hypothetical protein